MQEEIWKDVVGYVGMYEVSNLGRVRSLAFKYPWRGTFKINKPTILKPWSDRLGYKQVEIRGKFYLVHRLVAQAFIPNPYNLPEVNHKDEDKANNAVSNLEWCDKAYNMRYSRKKIAMRCMEVHGRPIYRIDLGTNKRFDYPNIKSVERDGFPPKQVSAACAGSYNPAAKDGVRNKYKNNLWYYG